MNQRPSKTMKAVAIDRFGGIETLKTRELPIPDVGADEVGVRVEAAGVGVWTHSNAKADLQKSSM